MASNDNDASSVSPAKQMVAVIKKGFAQYNAAHHLSTAVPIQQQLMPVVMGFVGGNWAFMDEVLPHVGSELLDLTSGLGGGDIQAGARVISAEVGEAVANVLRNDPSAHRTVEALCRPGSDIVSPTQFNVALLVEQLLVSAVNTFVGSSQGRFSDNAKAIAVNFSGGWLEQIAGVLVGGRSGVMPFLQSISASITPMIISLLPQEVAMYAAIAVPMMLNMVMQFHQQFLREQASTEEGLYD